MSTVNSMWPSCCCTSRLEDVEINIAKQWTDAEQLFSHDPTPSHWEVPAQTFPSKHLFGSSNNLMSEDEKAHAREKLTTIARDFWTEALDGIPIARFCRSNPKQTYPIIFKLTRNLNFSMSQANIYPSEEADIIESYPMHAVKSIKRGAIGVKSHLGEHALSIRVQSQKRGKYSQHIGLLMANKQEVERFCVSLCIFHVIANRLRQATLRKATEFIRPITTVQSSTTSLAMSSDKVQSSVHANDASTANVAIGSNSTEYPNLFFTPDHPGPSHRSKQASFTSEIDEERRDAAQRIHLLHHDAKYVRQDHEPHKEYFPSINTDIVETRSTTHQSPKTSCDLRSAPKADFTLDDETCATADAEFQVYWRSRKRNPSSTSSRRPLRKIT